MRLNFYPLRQFADNTTLNTGTGGDVIATDDIAGVKHQRVKVEYGADGSATDVSAATPLPVVIGDGTNSVVVDTAFGDAEAASQNHLNVGAVAYVFNGTTFDRVRGVGTGTMAVQVNNSARTELRFFAVAAAAGTTTTETAISLTKSSGTSATSAAASWVVTSGKRFKITHLSFATRGNATATVQTTTFNFRINTAGAVTTTSTPIILSVRSATPATASAWDRYIVTLPADGLELVGDGTMQFGITAAATYTTNAPTWDVTIIGYEY